MKDRKCLGGKIISGDSAVTKAMAHGGLPALPPMTETLCRRHCSGGFGEEGREVFEAEAAPGFVTGRILQGGGNRNEFRTDNAAAPARDVPVGEANDVDDSKMDAANVGAVIVDRGQGRLVARINADLLHQFAPHALLVAAVAGEEAMILLGDVPANADGIQSVQAGFLPALAAAVSDRKSVV